MSSGQTLTGVIRHIRTQAGDEPADVELLSRYTRAGDEAAFAAVVRRYGGLVLGVARRQLADPDRADDVFQATFLALARSATRLANRPTLANWLYTVALRQARKARGRDFRREAVERAAPSRPEAGTDPLDEITGRELLRVVDEELERLPDRLRLPVLLCCVQGLSREDAARRLGWSDGAVKGRLERGRRRLAARLAARGLAPSAVVLAPLASAALPAELLARTAELTTSPWSKSVPPAVAALATASPGRKLLPAVAVAGCVLAVGLAGWAVASGGNKPVEPSTPPAAPLPVPEPVAAAKPATNAQPDDPLPAGSTLRFGTSRFRHGTTIETLAVSTDGKWAVASSGGRIHGTLRGYDLTTGRAVFTLGESTSLIDSVAISPDGKMLATKRTPTITLYDVVSGQETARIELPSANPYRASPWIEFSPDGKRLIAEAPVGNTILLIDVEQKKVIRAFQHADALFAAAFSPDGKTIAGGGYDREGDVHFARLWDAETGKELRRFKFGGGIRTLAFSADGKTIAIGGDSGGAKAVKLFDVETATEKLAIEFKVYSVRGLALSPDGKTVAASGDNVTRLFDTTTGKEKVTIDRRSTGLRFSPDGASLVGAVGGVIYRWDAATGRSLIPDGGDSVVGQIEVTADGKRVVSVGQEGDAHVWDAKTGAHVRRVSAAWQKGIGLSPDGKFLTWSAADESVKFKDPRQPNAIHTGSRLRLFDLTTGQTVERFGGFEGEAHDLFFTDEGKTLVTVDHRDAVVRVWDAANGKEARSFRVVRDNERKRDYVVWRTRLSPDGKVLAVAYQRFDNTTAFFGRYAVRLWDTATGKELHDLVGHWYYVEAMAFSPDSRLLVTGSQPLSQFSQQQLKEPADQVFVWDVDTGKAVARLPIGASAAAFSPDGKTLAVGIAAVTEINLPIPESPIQLWNVATWKLKGELPGHHDRITAMAFTPDGRLLSGSVDTTVLAWDVRLAKPPAGDGR
jgi:RNA polymerase sigma factor (sigma-70 family)